MNMLICNICNEETDHTRNGICQRCSNPDRHSEMEERVSHEKKLIARFFKNYDSGNGMKIRASEMQVLRPYFSELEVNLNE